MYPMKYKTILTSKRSSILWSVYKVTPRFWKQASCDEGLHTIYIFSLLYIWHRIALWFRASNSLSVPPFPIHNGDNSRIDFIVIAREISRLTCKNTFEKALKLISTLYVSYLIIFILVLLL